MTPKLINLFLPDGNPNGLKVVEISNRNIRGVLVPRARMADVKNRAELTQPAIYILSDREGSKVYIGECENFIARLRSHDQGKDFWEIAVAFIAKDKSIDKGDIKFLESLAVTAARDAKRSEVLNSVAPALNSLHEFKAQVILEFFEDLKLLLSTLGYPVFDKIQTENVDENDYWYCNRRATKAKAVYDENGFTVLAGSIIDGTQQPSFVKYFSSAVAEREKMFKDFAHTTDTGKTYVITENITFTSANKASGFVIGASVNAWTNWKNKDGRTMDEVLRQGL